MSSRYICINYNVIRLILSNPIHYVLWKNRRFAENLIFIFIRFQNMSDSSDIAAILKHCLTRGIPLNPLPSNKNINNYRNPNYPHAPTRTPNLSPPEFALAVKNALRYFPTELHNELAEEFATELKEYGHIYMYRLKPTEYPMRAYPVHYYPAKCQQAACIMLMIQNNLDPNVAQFPDELITYGGNGSVLSNWAQYHLLMYYLSQLTETATLSMYSGMKRIISHSS